VLEAPGVLLREVQPSDAPALASMLGPPEVAQFLPPGPTTQEEFETFIAWAQQTRQAGRYISLAVVPRDIETAVGIFQIWPLQPDFGVAEWGFALGRPFWGTGLFLECARLVIDFAFETLGVQRLEARAAVDDPRGNAALWKVGAVREVVMRKCFPCADGEYRDHVMWSIRADAWGPLSADRQAAEPPRGGVGRSYPSENTGAISRSWPVARTPRVTDPGCR
jgi:RimJ/RimL family protein N-acetyltransferase